jgi:hypothetical protein
MVIPFSKRGFSNNNRIKKAIKEIGKLVANDGLIK